MAFYDLQKTERKDLVDKINQQILSELRSGKTKFTLDHLSDEDTYIRKTAYLAIGKLYSLQQPLHPAIFKLLEKLFKHEDPKVRQTVINAAGEIGKTDFASVAKLIEKGLFDEHHSVRNAVIGSIKKMGEKNPKPVLAFAKQLLHHPNKEVRREICHGIELRGRTHPQDILPLLKELQGDKTARVRKTLVHVIGQIAYKKGCLETVVEELKKWKNKELVKDALEEIIDVHHRYRDFSVKTQDEAIAYILRYFPV